MRIRDVREIASSALARHVAALDFVDHVDRVEQRDDPGQNLTQLNVGDSTCVCFDAFAGAARVIGASYRLRASRAAIAVLARAESNCATIHAASAGGGTLTAEVDARSIVIPFAVAP